MKIAHTLREKCPNTEFFLVRIQSECEKIRTRKTPYLDTFHAVMIEKFFIISEEFEEFQ